MDVVDLFASLFGPLLGVLFAPVAALVLFVAGVRAHRKWPYWVAGTLLIAFAVSTWFYWKAFWRGFGYVASTEPRPMPGGLELVENVALGVSALTCLALVVAAVCAARLPRPEPLVGRQDEAPPG